jgi:hypothetical protein
VIVLRGVDPDLERLWAAIEPVVGVLPVLEGSDAWIRQGVGPGMRNGPRSRELWEKEAVDAWRGCSVCTVPGS